MIRPEKIAELKSRMERLQIHDSDLTEKFITGGGSGGQKINKTSSCVYLKHGPTGIEVKCQKDRSRELNRFLARRELCDKLESQIHGVKTKKEVTAEKVRKQKQRRSRRQSGTKWDCRDLWDNRD